MNKAAYVVLSDTGNNKKKKDDALDIAVILCIVFAIIALLLIIPIVILWVKTKRQRDQDDEVQLVGERSWEERNAELLEQAVDLEAEDMSAPTTPPAPGTPRVKMEISAPKPSTRRL